MVIDQKTFNSDFNKFKTIALTNKFNSIDEIDEIENKQVFAVKGALTESKTLEITKDCEVLKIDDFTKIFLDYNRILDLSKKHQVVYSTKYELASFVVIFKDVLKKDFERLVSQSNLKEPVLYNPYEN